MAKKLVIIDTDCGIDDAQALMMALAAPNIQILGITCVFGNASVENVCQNILRVLSICERDGVSVLELYLNDLTNSVTPEQTENIFTSVNSLFLYYYFVEVKCRYSDYCKTNN